jgi:predicted PurR-regulated permease PerM
MIGKISLKKVNSVLLCGVLITAILYYASQILIPLMFAIFFAMLFTPLCNRMERKISRVFASLIAVFIILIAVLGIGTMVFFQSKKIAADWPQIEKRSAEFMKKAQGYVNNKLDVPVEKQDELIDKRVKKMMETSGQTVKRFLSGLASTLGMFAIVLIFTFLFLLQRDKYEAFFIKLGGGETRPDETRKVIRNISSVAQAYLTGRLMSITIFFILFTTGFLIVGLENAVLLALVAALLTIIPYVGSILGGLFPVAFALVTSDTTGTAIATFIVVLLININDNYVIEPNIIGGQVRISPFWSIFILLIGGSLWGVAGMVLFLPMLAVTKIIFDAVPDLKAYGYLIGDQREEKPSKQLLQKLRALFGKKTDHRPETKTIS